MDATTTRRGPYLSEFTFEEVALADPEEGWCVCDADIRVHVRAPLPFVGRLLERFICATSKQKIVERDVYLKVLFAEVGPVYTRSLFSST